MLKGRWISLKVSEKVFEMVKATALTMGVSVSEFARQAVLEKLERMNVLSSEVKAILSREIDGRPDTSVQFKISRGTRK